MKKLYERNMFSKVSHFFMSWIMLSLYSKSEEKSNDKKQFNDEFNVKHGFKAEERMLHTASAFWFFLSLAIFGFCILLAILSLIVRFMIIDPDVVLWLTGTLAPFPLLYFIKLQKLKKLKQKLESSNLSYVPSQGFWVEVRNSDLIIPVVTGILLYFAIFR